MFDIFAIAGFLSEDTNGTALYFLDVGQGDSELITFAGGVNILIDAGPANGRSANEIGNILPFTNKKIDLAILTHPEIDHYGGFADVIKSMPIRSLALAKLKSDSESFEVFEEEINSAGITRIVVSGGDKIHYRDSVIEILWPRYDSVQKNMNDNSMVTLLRSDGASALFSGDVGFASESAIASFLPEIDILKVAHHGSKYSSGNDFLSAIKPKLAFIEVGKNSYGHPSMEAVGRILDSGAEIFRTDEYGTIKAEISGGHISVFGLR